MKPFDINSQQIGEVVKSLKNGKVGVMPTDTIYGIVGSALNPKTVEEIYQLRKRATDKPMIILISAVDDLKKFDIKLTSKQKEFLKKLWPNPVSVILPCKAGKFKYLHRGMESLAFRMPNNEWLIELLKNVGPLVAPSANFEGQKPPENIDAAKKYFGDRISFYTDGGRLKLKPSTIIQLYEDGTRIVLRAGSFKV